MNLSLAVCAKLLEIDRSTRSKGTFLEIIVRKAGSRESTASVDADPFIPEADVFVLVLPTSSNQCLLQTWLSQACSSRLDLRQHEQNQYEYTAM